MSSLEHLPPDQRAVLALVLQRGRSYDEIANLLAIDRAAVRDRALAALDALGPSEPHVPAERRALITDYLLGQLPGRVREEIRERLASFPSERAWARVLVGELAPMATTPLPKIPSPQAASAQAASAQAASAQAATPQEATPQETTPRAASTREEAPAPARQAATPQTPRRPPSGGLPGAAPAEAPSSRRDGAILLAVAALIAVVLVIVIIATSGGSSPKKSGTTHAATPTTSTATGTTNRTATTPHVIAQIILRPRSASSKAAGVAEIVTEGKLTGVIVAADHLTPNTSHNAYAVWLYNPGGAVHLLGYVSPAVGKNGDLKTSGTLPANVASFKELLVTLETTTSTKTPGPTVLQGNVSLAGG